MKNSVALAKRHFTIAAACLLASFGLALTEVDAQDQSSSVPEPLFRVQSSLVLADVITRDLDSGLPVRDLAKDDFRVFDNGHKISVTTFDAGALHDTRPVNLWLVVICNEAGKNPYDASAGFMGKESLFRPALDHLEKQDAVGVAHWCDNGEAQIDLPPTGDHDNCIRALAEALRPIEFHGGTPSADQAGEEAFRKVIRLIIRDAYRRNPKPLPVIVFLHGDYTGQPHHELNMLVDDFLETSGIVFGIQDDRAPGLHMLGEQSKIMHYMAGHTGGEYFSSTPEGYASALEAILTQLHFRYELGFVPAVIDGQRHALRIELTGDAKKRHRRVRLQFRPEYIPIREQPEWVR